MKNIQSLVSSVVRRGVRLSGLHQSENKIASDSQEYWSNAGECEFRTNSHWRGEGGLPDDTWDALGRIHMRLFDDLIGLTQLKKPLDRIVEWGCGGGANAIHFAKFTRQFIGVDVSQASLDECARNVAGVGCNNFVPVHVDVSRPEAATKLINGSCDLFLCTYVFELIPSPEYGVRLLSVARELLRPGGVALIQIKYQTVEARTRERRWGYRANLANMTTYPIHTFWELAEAVGLVPKAVTLQPKQPLVNEERYAYFLLTRAA